ncbi:MAG: hypothetical protein R8M11_08405, partial [Gallionella sp.]
SGKHEAPLVVGHPKHDDPAFGWPNPRSSATVGLASAHIGSHRLTCKIQLMAIFDYIECFYNRNLIHQSIGYRTSYEVERLYYEGA